MAGIAPVYKPVSGDDQKLLARIVSLNLARRHLSESQRGMIAAALANMKVHQNQHTKKSGPAHAQDQNSNAAPVSVPDAAKALNVGTM